MAITLHPEIERSVIASLKKYAAENLDESMGDLKASLLLDFILKEVGPCIYNQAIREAQTYMQEKVAEADGTCYEEEFGYWVQKKRT